MMVHSRRLFAVVWRCVAASAALAGALLPGEGRGQGSVPLAELPMQVHTHGVYLPLSLNGGAAAPFQFDSAAGWHAVNRRLAESWGLRLREHPSGAEGAGDGRARAAEVLGAEFRLGAVTGAFTPAAAIDLEAVSDAKGITLNGLLGAPLLKKYVVETDVEGRKFRIYDAAVWKYQGRGQELPLRVDEMGVPHIRVRFSLGGVEAEGEFKIDSAAGGTTLYFSSPFARQHQLLEAVRASGGKALEDEVMGVGGSSKLWFARAEWAMVGTTRFEGPVVGITEAKGGTLARSDLAGIVGGGLLHRFRVIYDCPHGRIYLEPSSRVGERFEHDMAGLKWLNTGEGRKEFRVRSVRAGSPAGEAGLRPGDVLVRVDGKRAGEFDRSRLTRYLQREGRAVRMEVRRGEALVGVEFQLKRML